MKKEFYFSNVYLYPDYVDMRKGHDGLSHIVTYKANLELLSGSIFLFINKSRNSIKGIFWDGNGLVIIHKKLEKGRFFSIKDLNSVQEISSNEFGIIFSGGLLPIANHQVGIKMIK